MGVHETSREGGSLPYCLSKEEKGSNPNVKNREMGQRNEDYNYWDIGCSCKKNWNVVLGNPQRNNSVMFGKEQEKHWGCGLLPQPVWSVSCCCLWWAMVAIFCIQNHPKFRIPREIPLGTSRFKHHPSRQLQGSLEEGTTQVVLTFLLTFCLHVLLPAFSSLTTVKPGCCEWYLRVCFLELRI